MKLLLVLSFILWGSHHAQAGSGTIAVMDGERKLCQEGGNEHMVVRLTSDEAIASLKNWLHHRPQDLAINERHIKAPAAWKQKELKSLLEIAFTGYIKFCGEQERRRYFGAMMNEMKSSLSDERIFVLVLLHSRSKLLLEIVEEQLASQKDDPSYRAYLEKAKRLILYQRKSPEPYPTEKVVRRIEKRLLGQ